MYDYPLVNVRLVRLTLLEQVYTHLSAVAATKQTLQVSASSLTPARTRS